MGAGVHQVNPEHREGEKAFRAGFRLSVFYAVPKDALVKLLTPTLFRFETRHPETGERIEVEAEFLPALCGSRDVYGAPLEPDDPAEMRIRHAWTGAGAPVPFGGIEPELEREAWEEFRIPRRLGC